MSKRYAVQLTEREAYAVFEIARLGTYGLRYGDLKLMTDGQGSAFSRAMLRLELATMKMREEYRIVEAAERLKARAG